MLYSAQFGEQALESLTASDAGRNSLFTEVLRSELLRPGQSLIELAERVKLMVRAIAADFSRQQEPEIAKTPRNPTTSCSSARSVASASASRRTNARGNSADWNQIKNLRKRELLERHRRRFDTCAVGRMGAPRRSHSSR